MVAKVNLKLGSNTYQFEVEEKDELETLHKIIVLGNPLKTCNNCNDVGYENKYFTANKSKSDKGTFIYINVKCGKCSARSKLGQLKDGGYFWHQYELYNKSDQNKQPNDPDFDDSSDIPSSE